MNGAKIKINLLPFETIAEEAKRVKFYKIQFAGVTLVLVLIFLTSLTLALQILQSRSIVNVQAKLTESEQKVTDLKGTQASLLLLKNRMTLINQYLGVSSKQSLMYKLIEKLTPQMAAINAMTVDKNGSVVLLASVPDSQTLESLITNLSSKELNEDKIGEVSVENLNRSRDGVYRVSLKITPK